MHYYEGSVRNLFFSAFVLALIVSFWFKDLIIEGQYIGAYTLQVNLNLRMGFMLFLVSEAMFFFSFF